MADKPNANFTPEQDPYKKLIPLNLCQLTNFPFIDETFDSLTYYEFLCKIVEYLNNVIENEKAVTNNTESLLNAYNQLQDYVNHYFDNLDIQEEINNKIDEMLEDGTFDNLIGNIINNKFQEIDNIYNNMYYLSNFYNKILSHKTPIIINCQGDSLTYGHDTVSSDKRSPDPGSTDSGVSHSQTRASITYPEQLQNLFNQFFTLQNITINNLGFSGDTAITSYEKWFNNRNADLVLLMLGTNDSGQSSWVSSDYRNNVELYLKNMEKIIQQYLNWNTAIILLTPPALNFNSNKMINGSINTQIYRNALKLLGNKYNIPIIDTDNLITNNFDSSYYSDSTHFNAKGYKSFANQLFSIFAGTGILNDNFNIYNIYRTNATTDYPIISNNIDNVLYNRNSNSLAGNNSYIELSQNGKIMFGFNCKFDNALVFPVISTMEDSVVNINLDNSNSQSNGTFKNFNGFNLKPNLNIDNYNIDTNNKQLLDNMVNSIINNYYILINSKGLHNITISNNSNTNIYFNGFYVIPLEYASSLIKRLCFNLPKTESEDYVLSIPYNLLAFILTGNLTNNTGDWYKSIFINIDLFAAGNYNKYYLTYPYLGANYVGTPSKGKMYLKNVFTENNSFSSIKRELTSVDFDNNNINLHFSNNNVTSFITLY